MVELIEACDRHFGVFIISVVFLMIVLTSLAKGIVSIVVSSSRERTRREVAAYIAEGSITPDQGERLLRAPVNGKEVNV